MNKIYYIDLTAEEIKEWESTVYIWKEQDIRTDYPVIVNDESILTWSNKDDAYYTHKSNIKHISKEEIEEMNKFKTTLTQINPKTLEVDPTDLNYVNEGDLECEVNILDSHEPNDTKAQNYEIFNKIHILLNNIEPMIKEARHLTNESDFSKIHLAHLLQIKKELKEINND